MRQFDTGATRDTDTGKLDYEGFLSPLAMKRFAEYMHANRSQRDGQMRDSDNWQKGIPMDAYMKSGWRHFFEWWETHRQTPINEHHPDEVETALCALWFNVQGYLHEHLKQKGSRTVTPAGAPLARGAKVSVTQRQAALDLRQLPLL